jgi:hypothetical protein
MRRVVILLGLVALVGCGKSAPADEPARVRAAYAEYTDALRAGDGEQACGLLTTEAKARASLLGPCEATLSGGAPGLPSDEQIARMPVAVHGDTATYRLPDEQGTARKVGDHWLIGVAQ